MYYMIDSSIDYNPFCAVGIVLMDI